MRNKLHTHFGERLKCAREAKAKREGKKYTQDDLAQDMNVSLDTIKNWEQNYNIPKSSDDLFRLCDLLQCDLDYLFNRIDEKTHDMKFIVDETKISEEAIENIQRLNSEDINALNTLLEDKDFSRVLSDIAKYKDALKDYYNSYDEFIEGINSLMTEIASNTDNKSSKDSAQKRVEDDKKLQQSDIYLDAMQYKIDSSFQNVIHNISKKDKSQHDHKEKTSMKKK